MKSRNHKVTTTVEDEVAERIIADAPSSAKNTLASGIVMPVAHVTSRHRKAYIKDRLWALLVNLYGG